MKNPIFLFLSLGFVSCAIPRKALIIAEGPQPVPQTLAVTKPEPALQAPAEDRLRMPDMFALPDEGRLRSPAPSDGSGDATVTTRPPAE